MATNEEILEKWLEDNMVHDLQKDIYLEIMQLAREDEQQEMRYFFADLVLKAPSERVRKRTRIVRDSIGRYIAEMVVRRNEMRSKK